MDELEFRRTVVADPHSDDEKVRDCAAADPAKQKFVDDMRQFDDQISAALKVDVPENLAERLILRQTLESHTSQKRRNRVNLAIAASVAFAAGLGWQVLMSPDPALNNNIGTYSLAHVNHGLDYLTNANEDNTLDQVNVKLARFGGEMVNAPGKAVFANYCDFNGVTSLHLIYEGQDGRYSVFVTPAKANFEFVETFGDQNYIGRGLDFNKAQITVVGDKGKQLDGFTDKLKSSLRFKA